MRGAMLVGLLLGASAWAQSPESERAIQRALIQRDQQSAEFAEQLRGAQDLRELQRLHEQQLRDAQLPLNADPDVAARLFPYQRERMAQDRVLRLAPPVVRVPAAAPPLPLPGGPKLGVEPVTPQGFRG
jgi:hypothetical protein